MDSVFCIRETRWCKPTHEISRHPLMGSFGSLYFVSISGKVAMNAAGRIHSSIVKFRDLPVVKSKMRATYILFFSRDYLRAAAVAIFLTACPFAAHSRGQRTTPPLSKSPVDHSAASSGRKTFESVGAACHGLDGRGGERGPNIATRAEVQGLTDEETFQILQSGIPAAGMPAF